MLLLPGIIPVLAALTIAVIRRLRPGYGLSWLVAVLGSLALWGVLLAYKFSSPPPLVINGWLPRAGVSGSLVFLLDDISWTYTFSLSSLMVLVILTAPARLKYQSNPPAWSASLALTGIGSLAMMAGTPLAVVLAWTALDVYELVIMLSGVPTLGSKIKSVTAVSARVLGTFFLILAMVVRQSEGQALVLIDPGPWTGAFILIAVGLRLGVIPLHLPYILEYPMRRGLGTILRLASPMASLVLLARLPQSAIPEKISPYLLAFAGLAALYGAAMWVNAEDEINGRPYWLIAVAGMAVASSTRGFPLSSMAWGSALGFCGGIIFLFSERHKRLAFIPVAGMVILSGLPYTPTAYGWNGLITRPINFPDVLFFLAQILVLWGYLKHGLCSEDAQEGMDLWVRVVYIAGFILTIISAGLISLLGWKYLAIPEFWWASLVTVIVAAGLIILVRKQLLFSGESTLQLSIWQLGRWIARVLHLVFSLGWFYRLLTWLFRRTSSVVLAFTEIIEGDGGVLWVLVLVVLVLSISLAGAG